MKKLAIRALFTGTAAGAALMLGATAALAATLTVTVTHANASGLVTSTSGTTILKDTRNNDTLTCTSSTGTGVVKNQVTRGTPPVKVGTITKTTFTNCTGPLGIKFAVKQNGTWNIVATKATSGGVTAGGVTNVSASLSGSVCTATVAGSVQGTVTNPSGTKKPLLKFSPTAPNPNKFVLKIKTASCLGVLRAGDIVQYTGSYTITNPTHLTVSAH
jgi:hypothetical protein